MRYSGHNEKNAIKSTSYFVVVVPFFSRSGSFITHFYRDKIDLQRTLIEKRFTLELYNNKYHFVFCRMGRYSTRVFFGVIFGSKYVVFCWYEDNLFFFVFMNLPPMTLNNTIYSNIRKVCLDFFCLSFNLICRYLPFTMLFKIQTFVLRF